MSEQSKAVVIGGGQAGLAISYYLTQHCLPIWPAACVYSTKCPRKKL